MGAAKRLIKIHNIKGLVPYGKAWRLQQQLVKERIAWQKEGRKGWDTMLVLEHKPVYTLGRSAKIEDLKGIKHQEGGDAATDIVANGYEVHKVDRGGQVTYHGPGQIVVYPIIDLHYHKKDLRWYVRGLEEVVIKVCTQYGIEAGRDDEHTGVWVNDNTKIAAIGVSASRWVTCHGLALNVDPDLEAFDHIVPCGILDRKVGSLKTLAPLMGPSSPMMKLKGKQEGGEEKQIDGTIQGETVRQQLIDAFEEVFGPELEMRRIEEREKGKDVLQGILERKSNDMMVIKASWK